eukprot:COSAG05_NODE_3702_length_1895_cov_3.036748_2_plen_109_part_00
MYAPLPPSFPASPPPRLPACVPACDIIPLHGRQVPISVGWGWSRHEAWNETNAARNIITKNRAHDYKQTLNDGGGIYMLGPQNQSEISRTIHLPTDLEFTNQLDLVLL